MPLPHLIGGFFSTFGGNFHLPLGDLRLA